MGTATMMPALLVEEVPRLIDTERPRRIGGAPTLPGAGRGGEVLLAERRPPRRGVLLGERLSPSPSASALWSRRRSRFSKCELKLCVSEDAAGLSKLGFDATLGEEFEMLETIGRGSQGFVQRAVRRSDGTAVALKRPFERGGEAVAAARKEQRLTSQLCHRSVLQILEVRVDGDCVATVMELLPWRSLQDAVRKAPGERLPPRVVRGLASELIAGVEHLHLHGVVHCDLKPQNILVSPGLRRLKIIDFGCARDAVDPGDGLFVGSRLYAAPEVLRGEPVAEPCDVWAAGACLYFALTGELPQSRGSIEDEAALERAADAGVRLSGPLWEQVSPECRGFFHRCLATNPGERSAASALAKEAWLTLKETRPEARPVAQ